MPNLKKNEIKKLSASELTEYEKSLSNNIAEKSIQELSELAKVYSASNFTLMRSAICHIIDLREKIVELNRELTVAKSIVNPINNKKSDIWERAKGATM